MYASRLRRFFILESLRGHDMSKAGKIIFWVLFPILTVLFTLLAIFYFEIIHGPIIYFILMLIAIVAFIVVRIILRHKRFWLRGIPTLALILTAFILVSVAKPTTVRKSAAYYADPVQTERLAIESGLIQGVYNEDKTVRIYAGIPYAKAPVGELRWKAPQPVEHWDGVKDCSYFGDRAMQDDGNPAIDSLVNIYAEKGWHPTFEERHYEPMSEDCLNLTVWRPNISANNLPILVYIHGGSLTTGSCNFEDYNGEEVAKKGVIMINIQYRLGIFGYFAHQSLLDKDGTTGNYGLLDQIEALKWVNRNASYFGGDKNNITIAGESAGSSSVSALCSSPLAKNLFKRAIGESSSIVVKKAPHTYRDLKDALKVGQKILDEFNCSNVDELRKVDASKLIKTQYSNSAMTLDGFALTKTPYEAYLANENNEEALLNGFNVLEGDAFVVPNFLFNPTNKDNIHERLVSYFNEETAAKMEKLYKNEIEKDAFKAFNEIISVYWFMHPHYSWRNMAMDNGVKVYSYQFTKENGFYGTYHSGEMIYAYGNVYKSKYDYRYNQSDVKLSNTMLAYWTNFAKTGNPNSQDLPLWEETKKSTNRIQELGSNVGPIVDPYLDLYPIIDEYIDYIIAHPKADN